MQSQEGYLAIPATTPTSTPPSGVAPQYQLPHQQVHFYPAAFIPHQQPQQPAMMHPSGIVYAHPVQPAPAPAPERAHSFLSFENWSNPKYLGLADEDPSEPVEKRTIGRKAALFFNVTATLTAIVNATLFLVWLFTSRYPWFIYPLYGSIGALGLLYIILTPMDHKFLIAHVFTSTIVNLFIISTYIFAYVPHPWFIYIFFPSAALLAFHAILTEGVFPVDSKKHQWFCIHALCFFLPINVMLFISWAASSHLGPWFIYPFFPTLMLLLVHFIATFYWEHPHKWLIGHASLSGTFCVWMFLIWYRSGADFPWFIIIWLSLAVPLFIHMWIVYRPMRFIRNASGAITDASENVNSAGQSKGYTLPSTGLEEGTFDVGESNLEFADSKKMMKKSGDDVDQEDELSLKKKTPPGTPQSHV